MSAQTGGPDDSIKPTIGCPVDVASGMMYHQMVDVRIDGPLPIELVRRYSSVSAFNDALGYGWQHNYMIRLTELADQTRHVLVDKEMRRVFFNCSSFTSGVCQQWYPNNTDHLSLIKGTAPASPPWQVVDKHQMKYDFDASGTLTGIHDRNGNTITLGYNLNGKLESITDTFGRTVTLHYMGSHIDTVTAGPRTVAYTYDGDDLQEVDFPDGSLVTYEYNASHNMTFARDAQEQVIEGHTYDGNTHRVTHTESQGGNRAYTLQYDFPSPGKTTVTNSRAVSTEYTLDTFLGVVTDRTGGPGCSSCGGGVRTQFVYDSALNLNYVFDGRGVETYMTYDDNGNMLTRKEAVGTVAEREWTYTYHPTFNYVTSVSIPTVGTCSNPNRIVSNMYNSTGDRTQEQITGCNGPDPFSFTTNYTYDVEGHGRIETIDGPRSDVSDMTTYNYFDEGDPEENLRGRLMRVTNGLGQMINYSAYDLFGNVGSVIDPNNVETTYLYDGRDRVTETRVLGPIPSEEFVTINEYDTVGRLYRVRLPNCVDTGAGCLFSTQYRYVDGVGWLEEVQDAVGNKIGYSYDADGNRTREVFRNPSDVVLKFTNYAYDTFNRLRFVYYSIASPDLNNDGTVDNPAAVFSQFTYDSSGNRVEERDPEGHITSFTYDQRDRLKTTTQTAGSDELITTYGYDDLDGLTSITDPMELVTTYQNGDMGWRLNVTSPDTGVTSNVYDAAGNLTSSTDARNITTTRGYDALNRPITVEYPDTALNVAYSYDSGDFGIGRRTGMTDPSGSSISNYDRRGLLTEEVKTIAEQSFLTQYRYDKNGNLTKLYYPPYERQVEFTPDAADRITSVTAELNGSPTPVANTITYRPFGPRTSLIFGNGLVDSRDYDSRYRLGLWSLGTLLNYGHIYNNDSNLTIRTDNIPTIPVTDRTFGYDGVHRLTQAVGPWGMFMTCPGGLTYSYDKNGNRRCKDDTAFTTYDYVSGTNRLDDSTGAETATYGHDDAGNVTTDGTHTYQYDDANRLSTVNPGAVAAYTYDGDGRRVIKIANGTTTYYFYDPAGTLLTETVLASGTGKDYLYLDGAPLARIDWSANELCLDESASAQCPGGSVLFATKATPNVQLNWSPYPGAPNTYLIRRKLVTNPSVKTFDGNVVIAKVQDPMQSYDDPVLDNNNLYEYVISKLVPSESLFFYHTDHLDTPIAMTNAAASLVWRAEFLPFGGVYSLPVSDQSNNLRFPGQYFDEATGLHQNWNRDYAQGIGRYFEPDPIGLDGGLNIYSYVNANPIASTDPTGLAVCIYYISSHELRCKSNSGGNTLRVGPDGVFSGVGPCRDNPTCQTNENEGPIPEGHYKPRPDDRPGHEKFWRLEPDPPIPGWAVFLGRRRGGFMLHPGQVSLGCITVSKRNENAMSQYDRINDLLTKENPLNSLLVRP